MRRFMQLLVASTALATIAGTAGASNFIDIDIGGATTGKVLALAITQDDAHAKNTVSNERTGATVVGTGAFAVNGPWHNITIGQTSGAAAGNILSGSIKSGSGAANDFTATYATDATLGGNNLHSLALDAGGTALASIAVTNTGATANTITDQLKASGNVTYHLTLDGTGNTVTNTIGQPGSGEPVAAATSIALTVNATGNNNSITNTSTNSGAKIITVALLSSGNTVVNNFGAVDGAQTSTLHGDAGSKVNYQLDSSAAGTTADVTLKGVVGAGTDAAVVRVEQSGAGAYANVTVNGYQDGAAAPVYTMGTLATDTAGIRVTQVSANAYLNATVTGAATGYTAHITQ